ncbi:MAG: LysM peptidoglycan-binding domain-containing protein, partial [Candidatus Cloacimonadales bacterium]
ISIPNNYQHDPIKTKYLHEVKKGDTLWRISQREDVFGDAAKWTQLYNVNGMIISKPDLIYPEQLIYIENNSPYDELIEYTIKKGDNLWNIAYGSVLDLQERRLMIISNQDKFPNPNLIYPDEDILIKVFIID